MEQNITTNFPVDNFPSMFPTVKNKRKAYYSCIGVIAFQNTLPDQTDIDLIGSNHFSKFFLCA